MRLADAFAVELAALGKLWRRDKDPPLQLSAPLAYSIFGQAESRTSVYKNIEL